MPCDAAKKARTWEMKRRSLSVRRFQSVVSVLRSIDEATFVVGEAIPICGVSLEVYLLGSPE